MSKTELPESIKYAIRRLENTNTHKSERAENFYRLKDMRDQIDKILKYYSLEFGDK